jgi:hypothetical protein
MYYVTRNLKYRSHIFCCISHYNMCLRSDCHKLFEGVKLFPIEVELEKTAFQYNSTGSFTQVYLPSESKTSSFT